MEHEQHSVPHFFFFAHTKMAQIEFAPNEIVVMCVVTSLPTGSNEPQIKIEIQT